MAPDSFSPPHPNPFAADLFPDGAPPPAKPLLLHPHAHDQLEALLDTLQRASPAAVRLDQGQLILLKAPRAGYGKSHLLHHWSARARDHAFCVPLTFNPETSLSWKALLAQLLEALHQPAPDSSLTALDLVARLTFARILSALLRSRQLPCAQPLAAAAALADRPLALLDFADPTQAVATWFQEHFEQLLPPAVALLCAETGLSNPAAALWWRALCGYAQAGAEPDPLRLETLQWTLNQATAPAGPPSAGLHFLKAPSDSDAFHQQTLGDLCRLTAACRPLIFLLDHLDGFHGSSGKVLRLVHGLNEWRCLSGRTRFILSVNQDLWSHTFLKALPSALEDRLTTSEIALSGLSCAAAAALLRQRLSAYQVPEPTAERFLAHLDLPASFAQAADHPFSPRALLRRASAAWQNPWASPSTSPSTSPSPTSPTPDSPISSPFSSPTSYPENLPCPTPPSLPSSAPASSPPPLDLPPDQAVQRRFHHLRAHFSASPGLVLEPDRLFHLLKLSGQRLALVRFQEAPLPHLEGAVVGIWQSPGAQVLVGTEPYEDRPYWSALLAFAQAHCDATPGGRLLLFSAASAPLDLHDWLPQDHPQPEPPRFLDLQTLDHPQLATFYAADEVLRECEAGSLPLTSADGFAAMAPHLQNLWKKLTRPLAP